MLDLVKAFNRLPRAPVLAAAKHIGVPEGLVRVWGDYLTDLRRSFRIHGLVGESLSSTTGFPEGCGLSVVAMLLVAWTYDRDVVDAMDQPQAVDVEGESGVMLFADNFETYSTDPNGHDPSRESILRLLFGIRPHHRRRQVLALVDAFEG